MTFLACKRGEGCNYGFDFNHEWNLAKTACTVLDAIRFLSDLQFEHFLSVGAMIYGLGRVFYGRAYCLLS